MRHKDFFVECDCLALLRHYLLIHIEVVIQNSISQISEPQIFSNFDVKKFIFTISHITYYAGITVLPFVSSELRVQARILPLIFLNKAKKAIALSNSYYHVMSQKSVSHHNNNSH
jgi:hypothetical protein